MTIIGIDPGLDGAIAILADGLPERCYSMPTLPSGKGTGRILDLHDLADLIRELTEDAPAIAKKAFVEKQTAFKKQGLASTGKTFEQYGMIQALLAAHRWPMQIVRPQEWQKEMFCGDASKDTKAASLLCAKRTFPSFGWPVQKAKQIGCADALNIAEYGRRLTIRREDRNDE
jgi:crossover junction endodeoxyribonuclease RuvC